MNIGPNSLTHPFSSSDDLATTMADRIRHAHEVAQTDETTDVGDAAAAAAGNERPGTADPVGAKLRSELESLVANVLSGDPQDSCQILDRAIETIVDDRFQRIDLPDSDNLRQQVFHTMREDPTVVGELDEILQQIARQLALSGK